MSHQRSPFSSGMRCFVGVMLLAANASADPYAGVQVRDDADHPVRVGGGVVVGRVELGALLDPQGIFDGQHTADLAVGIRTGDIGLHAAWRNTSVQMAEGTRLYESLVAGASVPVLGARAFSVRAGLEVAALIVAHGEMPAQWLATDNLRRSLTADFVVTVSYGR